MTDKQSLASQSISSTTSTTGALQVVRFNPFDEVYAYRHQIIKLIFIRILLQRVRNVIFEDRFPQAFWIFNLVFNTLNYIGMTIRWQRWPLPDVIYGPIMNFFSWIDFTFAWASDTLLMMMAVIFCVITIIAFLGIAVSTMLNKAEKAVPAQFSFFVNLLGMLMTYPFYQPGVNAFIGNYQCYGIVEGSSLTKVTIDCKASYRLILTIICTVMMAVYLVAAGIIRMFIFTHDMKHGDLWTAQDGMFQIMQFLLITIYMFISLLLRSKPLVTGILGLVFFLLLMIYPIFARSFFHAHGNALQAGAMGLVVAFYISGTLSEIVDPRSINMFNVVMFWLVFLALITIIPLGVYLLTYHLSIKSWAIHQGDIIPDLPYKNNQLQNSNMQNANAQRMGAVKFGYEMPTPGLSQLLVPKPVDLDESPLPQVPQINNTGQLQTIQLQALPSRISKQGEKEKERNDNEYEQGLQTEREKEYQKERQKQNQPNPKFFTAAPSSQDLQGFQYGNFAGVQKELSHQQGRILGFG
ncbi:MAG: hypothetical protein EZS28_013356 [Streblomastix strix]|uniref:Transmembrane protein n=1 Tax=Streblomastix strix TaxID=222440 RepID=A0A5J4W8A5_9EUKA|nr:MAG: hypothetical protein EZS28_013356 [Streblomastix strix]